MSSKSRLRLFDADSINIRHAVKSGYSINSNITQKAAQIMTSDGQVEPFREPLLVPQSAVEHEEASLVRTDQAEVLMRRLYGQDDESAERLGHQLQEFYDQNPIGYVISQWGRAPILWTEELEHADNAGQVDQRNSTAELAMGWITDPTGVYIDGNWQWRGVGHASANELFNDITALHSLLDSYAISFHTLAILVMQGARIPIFDGDSETPQYGEVVGVEDSDTGRLIVASADNTTRTFTPAELVRFEETASRQRSPVEGYGLVIPRQQQAALHGSRGAAAVRQASQAQPQVEARGAVKPASQAPVSARARNGGAVRGHEDPDGTLIRDPEDFYLELSATGHYRPLRLDQLVLGFEDIRYMPLEQMENRLAGAMAMMGEARHTGRRLNISMYGSIFDIIDAYTERRGGNRSLLASARYYMSGEERDKAFDLSVDPPPRRR